MVEQYPHYLFLVVPSESLRNADGDFVEGESHVEFISKCHIDSQYDKVIKELEKIIASSSKKIPQEEKDKLILTIKSRSALKALIPNQP